LFNLIGLVVIASIAFAISSLARTTTRTILLWIGAWILVGMIADFPGMPGWFKQISFTYGLEQAEIAIFQITEIATRAAAVIPIYGDSVSQAVDVFKGQIRPVPLGRSLGGLAVLVGLSSLVFLRRFRPE
jgi:hypothetical protein